MLNIIQKKNMTKICDNKSVGILVWKDKKLLLIERKKFPHGFALPAGHVDEDPTFEISAKRELEEEVGLVATKLELTIEGNKKNICRRKGGSWHYWKIYTAEVKGRIKRSKSETKQVGWYDKKELQTLAKRTTMYLNKEITEDEWEKSPGLEPVNYEWFKELKII